MLSTKRSRNSKVKAKKKENVTTNSSCLYKHGWNRESA